MSTTLVCDVPVQYGILEPCKATFNSSGLLLVVEGLALGAQLPDEFDVQFEEGEPLTVRKQNGEHYIVEEDRTAFTAVVFG